MSSKLEELTPEQRRLLASRLRARASAAGTQGVDTAAGGEFPGSFAQQRLWLLDRLNPDQAGYVVPAVRQFFTELDVDAARRALDEIVRRHGALRTHFENRGGRPVQVVSPYTPFHLPVVDLSRHAQDERDDEVQRLLTQTTRGGFRLDHGPLFRATLVRIGPEHHLLLVAMHHAVTDGWSMNVFWSEFHALVDAYSRGLPSPLPPLPTTFGAYAQAQRERLSGPAMDRLLAHWRQALAGAPLRLELPADRPRVPGVVSRGAMVAREVGRTISARVQQLAAREGATPFMVLLAAFQVLLSRYARQDDLLVGTAIAGRTSAAVEKLIGFFANTLVLRGDLTGDPTFREYLGRVREVTLSAFEHQEMPFERLVEELNPDRSATTSPVVQVVFVLQNTAPPMDDAEDADDEDASPGETIYRELDTAKFELSLSFSEWRGRTWAAVEYAADLFDRETIERLIGRLDTLLGAALDAPDTRVSRLPLMSASEHAATAALGAAVQAHPVSDTLHARFAARAARTPDAVAVTFGQEAFTYRELDERANRVAHRLVALGAGPGALVGLCVERSLETVVGIIAILKAGAAYLPLDPGYPEDRLAYMLEDSGVSVVLTTSPLADWLPPSAKFLRFDADAEAIASSPATAPAERATPASLAYVIYTSGSTGRPKGVQVTHENVVRLFSATDEWFRFGADDVWTLFHSYAFDFSVWELWGALLNGGRLVVVPFLVSREPEAFYELLERERVTVLNQTPSAFRQLMRVDEQAVAAGAVRPLSLRYVVFGGEALDPASLRGWVDRRGDESPRLVNMYGITETTVHVTCRVIRGADVRGGSSSPIGLPIPDLSLHLLDAYGQLMPTGLLGEMYVGGAGVARGYLGRPELTAQRFVPDPFSGEPGARLYRSGDLARRLADGGLEFIGRADDQVKVRGFRIELGEIESALLGHPRIREAVVLTRGEGDERRLVAWVVAAEPVSAAELRSHLLGALPEYMVPSAFVLLDALPLTRNGKVDRRALPEPDASDLAGREFVAPRTPTEELLAAIWAELLGVGRVGAGDGFFDLGGHSLLATRVVARVREAFGVEVPLRAVFDHSVLAAQAAEIDRLLRATSGTEAPPIIPVSRDTDLPLSFAQERLWFVDRLEPGSRVFHMPFQYLLRGELDVDALRRAFTEVVRRHESLRTAFPRVDGLPVQRVSPAAPADVPLFDVTDVAESVRGAEATRLVQEAASRPFDLERGPLFRSWLVRVDADEHLLLVNLHHVITDGWSTGVLWNELSALYGAFSQGVPSPLPEPRIQYADYAHWQREWLRGEVLERQLAYWRGKLAGAPPLLELPTDRPRPAVQAHDGAVQSLRMEREVADAVLAFGRRENATLFMVLLAAWNVVLARWSGQDDVVVGTPVAGRTRAETDGVIGLFLNSLALRTDLSGNPPFRELLRRVRETTLEAYAHQDVPFERILEELQPERSLSHSPVFQVMLNLSNFQAGEVALPGLQVQPFGSGGAPPSKFDMTLYAGEAPDGLVLHLVYSPGLFGPERMREMLAQLASVLTQAAHDPTLVVGSVPGVSERVHATLPDPTLPLVAEPWEGAVHECFAVLARRSPDAVAVADRDGRWTYGELDGAASHDARRLVQDGIRPGDVAAIYAHRSAGLVRAMLATWKAGAAFVVLDPAYPPARLAEYVRIARPSALLLVASARQVPVEVAREMADSVLSTLVIGGTGDATSRESTSAPDVPVGPDDLAYLAFTSGTTGTPKAVAGTHRPLAHFFGWYAREFGLGAADRFSMLAGLAHDPLLRDIFAPLTSGGTLYIPDPEQLSTPGWLAEWMRGAGITVAHLTPAMGRLLAAADDGVTIPTLRLAGFGGDLLAGDDVHAVRALAPGADVVNLYGATETPQAMAAYRIPPACGAGTQPVGKGIDGAQLLVVAPGGGLAAVGDVGEIAIRTPYLSAGYRNDPQLTAARFVANPWRHDPHDRMYLTGDLGRYRADGTVEIAGRADQQVKVRGFRIEPGEVEAALRAHRAVREAVVQAHGAGEARVLVAWLTGDGDRLAPAELRRHLRAILPDYMVPSAFVWLDALPLTPNGKVDRRALPDPPGIPAARSSEPRVAEPAYAASRVRLAPEPPRAAGVISLLTDEARTILPDPAAPLSAEWRGSVPALFAAHAARTPGALAVEDPSEAWTYGELRAATNRIANRLVADGVRPGDVVAIWGHRSAALVRALLGTLSSGAAFLVLDPAYPPARLAEYVRIARPAGFLRIESAGEVPAEVQETVDATARTQIALGVRKGGEIDGLATVSGDDPGVEIGPDSLAYLSFTSGTTGRPKAVMGRHGSLTHFTPWLVETFGLRAADRFSMLSGLAHDPLHRDVFTPLQLGAAVVAPEADQVGVPGYLARWARDASITVAHLTPAMGQLLTDVADEGGAITTPSLRHAFFVGDVLTRTEVTRLHRLAPEIQVINYYGSTETQRAVGHFVVPRDLGGLEKETIPVGVGIQDVQLLLRTPGGERAGVGEVGEIWLRSPHVALGYLGDAELTAQRFSANAWTGDATDVLYRTGDLGRYRPDGVVEIAGRADQQVKVRGFRVEPGEIEAVLRAHPAVRDVAVVARGAGDERRLAAYVVADGGPTSPEVLREHLRRSVPEYMVPSALVFLDGLPLTPNGKVDRKALPEPDVAEEVPAAAPRTATEDVLAAIWAGVLGREQVGPADHFFSLGGHSLLGTRVVARIREAFRVELPLRCIFEHPTLAAQAAAIDRAIRDRQGVQAPPIVPVPRGETAPASFAQERLWFVDRLEGGGAVYHIPAAYRLSFGVDLDTMRAAVAEMVSRHETLRTALPEVDGVPVQRISPPGAVALPFHDLSGLPAEERGAELGRLAAEHANRPFDLERGPLFRVALVRMAPDDHVLLTNLHHVVGDGWSNGVLFRELTAVHTAFSRGERSPLPPLPVQYADYAAWQREWLRGEALETQLAYWRQKLAGAPPRLDLPTDRPRPDVQTHAGASERRSLSAEARARVLAVAREEGATTFMVLLAAFSLVLSRWSGQDDVVVGTPIAGRTRAETEGLIGPFLNTLALRTDVSGDVGFRALLRRVRESTLEAYAHQDVPFERVLEAVQPRRSLSHTPVFQVMLNLLNFGGAESPDGVQATRLGTGAQLSSKFDLTLYAADSPDGLGLHCVYNPDLFDAGRMRALLAQLASVLEQAAADPDRPASRISLATDGGGTGSMDGDRVVWTATGLPAGIGEVGQVWAREVDAYLPTGNLGRHGPDGSIELIVPPAERHAGPETAERPRPGFSAPPTDAELAMVQVWREVLGRDDVGPGDDFFDLGGHSLLGVRLLAAVRKRFGSALPVAELFRAPTPAALAAAVARHGAEGFRNLVPMRESGTRPPFFCVHPAGGTAAPFRHLAALLPGDRPFYAFQATGIDGDAPPLRTVGEVAERYVAEARRVQPHGPYYLGGWSAGGVIALEMAARLRAAGEDVALVAMFDTRTPDFLQDRAIVDPVDMYRRFAGSLVPAGEADLDDLAVQLRDASEDWQLALLARWIEGRGVNLEMAELDRLAGAVRVFQATARATREHHVSPYDGPVALFCAEEGNSGEGWQAGALPDKWRALGVTRLDVRVVPGTHAGMVLPPHAESLAAALADVLSRA